MIDRIKNRKGLGRQALIGKKVLAPFSFHVNLVNPVSS